MDSSDFLAALSFLVLILRLFGSGEAPLKELKSLIEISLVLELYGNDLIHSD